MDEVRHGKQLTLRNYSIKSRDTLFVMKIGFSLDITNPQVGDESVCVCVCVCARPRVHVQVYVLFVLDLFPNY